MGFLIFPTLLILTLVPGPRAQNHALEDFSRFSKAVNTRIAIVDQEGTVHEGMVTAATGDQVSVRIGAGEKTFARANVVSAQRMRDGRTDGAIKGALWGLVIGAFANYACAERGEQCHIWAYVAATAGIGYLFDAAEDNPQRFYRAPAPAATTAKPSMKFSFRF